MIPKVHGRTPNYSHQPALAWCSFLFALELVVHILLTQAQLNITSPSTPPMAFIRISPPQHLGQLIEALFLAKSTLIQVLHQSIKIFTLLPFNYTTNLL